MSSNPNDTKYVAVPGPGMIPERDKDKRPVLEASHLGIDFGGLTAVDEFNIAIGATEIGGLIGPNGAGKTTVFNLLTKVYQPTRGVIMLDGKDTHGMNTTQANKAGIARTFQNIRLFDKLTVEENVKIGLHSSIGYHLPSAVLRLPRYWREEKRLTKRLLSFLIFLTWQIWQMSDPLHFLTVHREDWRSCAHLLQAPRYFFSMSLPQE